MKNLSKIPLFDLADSYSKLIQVQTEESLARKLSLAESHEEFLAIKNVFLARKAFPDFSDLKLAEQISALAERFAEDFKLKRNAEWFIPAGLALFIDIPYKLLLPSIQRDSRLLAIWILFKYCRRGYLVPKQTDPRYINYNSLVPLIMSVYKRYEDKPYSSWSLLEAEILNTKDLYEAMTFKPPKLDYLDRSTNRDPVTSYGIRINGLTAPALAHIMLGQTWCAHPTNRTKYMILDPSDWDNMPAPLISQNLGI